MVKDPELSKCPCGWEGFFPYMEIEHEIKKGLLTYTTAYYCPECGEKIK
jgi:hypothetical protein